VTGNDLHVDFYALSDRGQVLSYNPALKYGTVLTGPLHYDDLQFYAYHWLVDTVTECDEEQDQVNVYDALYRQLNVDPATVPIQFKRPYAYLDEKESKDLEQFMYFVWMERKIDLRKTGYYVVAPFAVSSSRSLKYGTWLEVIHKLAKIRPVVIVGMITERMPSTDMTVGEFFQALGHAEGPVINAIGITPVRLLMSIISKATGLLGLDSGPFYIAQAFRVPAISVWGTHAPLVRIGYDKDYMDLAIWNILECRHAPCFSWGGFPVHKCPYGTNQTVCQCLSTVSVDMIMEKVDMIESSRKMLPPVQPGNANEKCPA
jgi:ADP-heptose:LPS heptosyltransferase